MRLAVLDHGHKPKQRLALRLMRLIGRTEPDPVAKTSLYRPELFGRPWLRFASSAMRGPSDWSAAERELLGAFVSRLNACPFCIGIHEGTTTLLVRSTVAVDQLDRWREASFDPRITATMALLEKVTLASEQVGPGDVEAARAAGVSDAAIVDALYVCFLFNTVNRLANAFGYSWKSEADRLKLAAGLNRIRYRVPEFLLR